MANVGTTQSATRRTTTGPPSPVCISAPKPDRRIIMSRVEIAAPPQDVWDLLTDYNNLATHIPNLALSRRKYRENGGIRLEQCGAQKILGFKFKASVILDMDELRGSGPTEDIWKISFKLHKSHDFKVFQGEWIVERLENDLTRLSYKVDIVPSGLIPVQAVEWRVREDVPVNLAAVQNKCQRNFMLSKNTA